MSNTKPHSNQQKPLENLWLVLTGFFIIVFFIFMLRRAWLCDDAYITFRTVDNFIHGYKLTWNTIERVQAYTHPLWMFLLSLTNFFIRNIYTTGLVLSILISTAVVITYAFKIAGRKFSAFLGILILCLSNAYIDYATSGLENPLTNLLLVIFFSLFFTMKPGNKKIFCLSLIASLAGVNRLDSMLLYFPAFLYALWELRTIRGFFIAIAGQFPLILWECFSVFYYGFPFPNTFYAKLNTGISSAELLQHGLYYFQNSLQRDPLTLIVILGSIVLAFVSKKKAPVSMAAGLLLYLLYILKIGGDFMSGRFFAAPLLLAVIILSQSFAWRVKPIVSGLMVAAVMIIGLTADIPTYLLTPPDDQPITDVHGITDERTWYFSDFALFSPDRVNDLSLSAGKNGAKARKEAGEDLYVIAVNNTGVFGYFAGPHVFVIDQLALSDPLLARLPAIRKVDWRIGHFTRVLPDGYISTIYGLGTIDDRNLAAYYEKLHLIVSGKLSDPRRLPEIWKMNTGQYDYLIDFDAYRYPEMVSSTLTQMECLLDENCPITDPLHDGRIYFSDSGLDIDLEDSYNIDHYELCLESDDVYQIQYLSEGEVIAEQSFQNEGNTSKMNCLDVQPPQKAIRTGFSYIRIFPLQGNGDFSCGGLNITDK